MNFHKIKIFMVLSALACGIFLGIPQEAKASVSNEQMDKLFALEDNIAAGTIEEDYGQIRWVIDSAGKLTVCGTGDVCKPAVDEYDERSIPWSSYRYEILEAEIDVTGMTDASRLFQDCDKMKKVDVSCLDTSQVTSMRSMFASCGRLEHLDLSNFDTSQVTNMGFMFYNSANLVSLDLSNFNTSKVTNMSGMFLNAASLKSIDLSNFDTGNITTIANMFDDCRTLRSVNLSNFVLGDNVNIESVFAYCDQLSTVTLPANLARKLTLPSKHLHVWKTIDGTEVGKLPENMTETITLQLSIADGVDITDIFWDVEQDWYTDYVHYVYCNRLMTGISGTSKFEPDSNITKAQVAQVLYNMSTQFGYANEVFQELTDVYRNEWYADAISWAYSHGIITGDTNTKKFYPNSYVTREQLALMLYRYAVYAKEDISKTSDLSGLKHAENVSNWAAEGVKWAVGSGLISGIDKNGVKDLAPQGNATRAQVAAILQRFCEANGR